MRLPLCFGLTWRELLNCHISHLLLLLLDLAITGEYRVTYLEGQPKGDHPWDHRKVVLKDGLYIQICAKIEPLGPTFFCFYGLHYIEVVFKTVQADMTAVIRIFYFFTLKKKYIFLQIHV